MNTTLSKESAISNALTIKAPELVELLTGAATHASKDKSLISLYSVQLSTNGTKLIANATDKYRLITGEIDICLVENESGTLTDSVISLDDIKQVITLAKSAAHITITRAGDLISFTSGLNTLTFNELGVNYPPFNHLLAPVTPAELTELFFNPLYFADIAKLCGKDKGKSGVRVTFGAAANKPYTFKVQGESVSWHGLIMPMR
jgi:hypothetical protein